jgi:site-specific DNA-cytosine methylase
MTKLRVFEAFSGYGSQSLALEYLGIPHEVVAISEVDKYAIQGYEALHGKANNLGDISKINVEDIPEHDLFTYSFPCQDISIAGRGLSLEPKILVVANTNSSFESEKRVYGTNGIAPTLTARDYKGAKQILIPQATKKGYIEMNVPGVCDLLYPNSKTRRGRVQEGGAIAPALMTSQMLCYIDEEKATDKGHVVCEQRCDEGLRFFKDNVCGTIRTVNSGGDKRIIDVNNYRIRKLTPSECLRLMGLHESEIEKLKASGLSNTRLYKLAGNSIVVNVLESIFSQLFKE